MQKRTVLFLILLVLFSSSCASKQQDIEPLVIDITPTDVPAEVSTALPTLTNTFEPTATALVIIDYQDTTMHRVNLARMGVYQSSGPKVAPSLVWNFVAGDSVYSAPVIFADTAYFGSYDGNLYAVDILSGELLWTFSTGGPVLSSPALEDGILYFGSHDGKLYALDLLSGEALWTFETGGRVVSSPAISDGLVYFGSYDGLFYALDAGSGQEVWRFEVEGIVDPDSGIYKAVGASPALSDGTVMFGSTQVGGASAELFFYGLDCETGEKLWEFQVWNLLTSPAVYDGVVYFGGLGTFYGLDVISGAVVLEFAPGIISTAPALADGVAYFSDENGAVYALDLDTREAIWTVETGSWYLKSPSISDGVLYIGSGDGFLRALDIQDGHLLWEYKVEEGISTPVVIYGGVIFIGGEAGSLFALK
jgi:outer membrane protein assembly factor BamB